MLRELRELVHLLQYVNFCSDSLLNQISADPVKALKDMMAFVVVDGVNRQINAVKMTIEDLLIQLRKETEKRSNKSPEKKDVEEQQQLINMTE